MIARTAFPLVGVLLSSLVASAGAEKLWKGTYAHGVPGQIARGVDQPIGLQMSYLRGKEIVLRAAPGFASYQHLRGDDARSGLQQFGGQGLRLRIRGNDVVYVRSASQPSSLDGHSVIPFGRPLRDPVGPFLSPKSNAVFLDKPGDQVVVGRVINGGDILSLHIRHAPGSEPVAWRAMTLSLYDYLGQMELKLQGPEGGATLVGSVTREAD